ncbi:hypothetical protein [Shinella zoogloeoides]|uniref:hypothetical protein n=1 Tax=Shinella zoogloeoides TaxID=352475 RepID=UPI001F5A069E|nr:hypothetical protein [Shinella zoogloeoides]
MTTRKGYEVFNIAANLNRWTLSVLMAVMPVAASASDRVPIDDGAYLDRKDCDLAERGELDLVSFTIGKAGREVSFEEAGCLVASVKPVRANRYDIELDCREFEDVYQHRMFLDVVAKDHIRVDGDDRYLCKKGFLADGPSASDPAVSVNALIEKWEELNENCRGGFGDDPNTMKACDQRSGVSERLEALGYCYDREKNSTEVWKACK